MGQIKFTKKALRELKKLNFGMRNKIMQELSEKRRHLKPKEFLKVGHEKLKK